MWSKSIGPYEVVKTLTGSGLLTQVCLRDRVFINGDGTYDWWVDCDRLFPDGYGNVNETLLGLAFGKMIINCVAIDGVPSFDHGNWWTSYPDLTRSEKKAIAEEYDNPSMLDA